MVALLFFLLSVTSLLDSNSCGAKIILKLKGANRAFGLFVIQQWILSYSFLILPEKLHTVTLYPTINMAHKAEILPLIRSRGFLTILAGILHFAYMRYAAKS